MVLHEITACFESIAPLSIQESYDNSGIIIGHYNKEISGVLCTVDITEDVVEEAVQLGANLIIAHHPILFSGIRSITGKTYVERIIMRAIKEDIALYALHTNIDKISSGVNAKICEKLKLHNCKILSPMYDELRKLVTFVPIEHIGKVREAIFSAGAGHIGNYDKCSFHVEGKGTFRGGEETNPFVGEKGKMHTENEIRLETIFPKFLQAKIIASLLEAHPYEEVAYDVYVLDNEYDTFGAGMIGELENEMEEMNFLKLAKKTFHCETIRVTKLLGKKIKRVAVCGGSGSFLLSKAIAAKADIFITGDFKYHQFFDAENAIVIADIGHFESEQFTKEIFFDILIKKFPKFAVHLSKINTNPINYL